MRKIIVIAMAVFALFAFVACGDKAQGGGAAAPAAGADKSTITVKNETGKDLNEMLISPVSLEDEWLDIDLFEGKVVKNGSSTTIPRSAFTKNEKYDLTWTSVDDLDYFKWEVDVKNVDNITVTKADLDDV